MTINNLGALRLLFTDKTDGNMSSSVGDTTDYLLSREQLLSQLPKRRNIYLSALHTEHVCNATIEKPDSVIELGFEAYRCDAIFADLQQANIWLMPGDCIPLIMYCQRSSTVGMIHISRKTIDTPLLQKCIQKYQKQLGIELQDIRIHVGPSIRREHYRFPKNIASQLFDSRWQDFLHDDNDDFVQVDLLKRTIHDLTMLNIKDSDVSIDVTDSGSGLHFSQSRAYYDSSCEGRNAAILYIDK
jgi:copper oxidase (laccase) domain-containing protein